MCQKFGVSGYPTIKYFVDGDMNGQDYQGGRDYASFKKLVEEKLAKCDIKDPKDCTDKEKAYMEKMKTQSAEERKTHISRLEGMAGSSMKPEMKIWFTQRLRILKGLNAAGTDEL